MYQTVMILLVTAVITIITTVITVRVTMTGRVVSPEAINRLRARGRRYGRHFDIGMIVLNTLLTAGWLAYLLTRKEPIDRIAVFLISFVTCGLLLHLRNLDEGIRIVQAERRAQRESLSDKEANLP
jgi:hypothetical protein